MDEDNAASRRPLDYLVGTPGGNRLVEGVADVRLTEDSELLMLGDEDRIIAVFAPSCWMHAVLAPAKLVMEG